MVSGKRGGQVLFKSGGIERNRGIENSVITTSFTKTALITKILAYSRRFWQNVGCCIKEFVFSTRVYGKSQLGYVTKATQ